MGVLQPLQYLQSLYNTVTGWYHPLKKTLNNQGPFFIAPISKPMGIKNAGR